ncbi:hypothetical protein NE619_09540 [Anaerovorax odorimutans]|uniref:Uncharacterized protein n=1 Tax=Anaerovorax odorimutans TaxID=109327 RepID=A0ABT1RP50_9FIRM|nr:hypothetical protein [Anaerovorax odorimutans]MCQ4636973.1 hypothetical protein [Anaerovorax odorimutans]
MESNFLLYAYFGINGDEEKDEIIKKAGARAYLDMCRTIDFGMSTEEKLSNKCRENLRNEVKEILVKAYYSLKNSVRASDESTQEKFDEEHRETCDKISSVYRKIGGLTFGQAQKWLNMTLKYLVVIQTYICKVDVNDMIPYLHVPVDKYIMEAAGAKKKGLSCGLGLKCVPRKHEKSDTYKMGWYSENGSQPWSRWQYCEYIEFQQAVRHTISEKKIALNPIDWESKAWMEVANLKA